MLDMILRFAILATPNQVVEKTDRGKKPIVILKHAVKKYVEKHNQFGTESSKPFEGPHISNVLLVIFHAIHGFPSKDHEATLTTPT